MSKRGSDSIMDTASLSQPATTAVQIALVDLLSSWGISPCAVCGHSSGEIAAAYAAGILDLQACLAVAYYRGTAATAKSTSILPDAGMMAIGACALVIEPMLESLSSGLVVVACYNSPDSVTVSGDRAALAELRPLLEERDIFHRVLKVDTAYHSDHMVHAADGYREAIAPFLTCLPDVKQKARFFSTVNGYEVESKMVQSPWYWVSNMVNPVQFDAALQTLALEPAFSREGTITLLEIGPHEALKSPIRQIFQHQSMAESVQKLDYFPVMKRGSDAMAVLLTTMASLITRGFPVVIHDLGSASIDLASARLLTDAPTYSFNHTRHYWHHSRLIDAYEQDTTPWNVMLGHKIPGAIGQDIQFRNVFKVDDIPWLADHVINDSIVFPMAGYISAAIEAIAQFPVSTEKKVTGYHIRDINVGRALILTSDVVFELFTSLKPVSYGSRTTALAGTYDFQISSWSQESGFVEHCKGSIGLLHEEAPDTGADVSSTCPRATWFVDFRQNCDSLPTMQVDCPKFYQQAAGKGIQYGAAFALMKSLHLGETFAVSTVQCHDTRSMMPMSFENDLKIHPTLLDACLHAGLCKQGKGIEIIARVPTSVGEIKISNAIQRQPGDEVVSYCHFIDTDSMSRSASSNVFCFTDVFDQPVIEIRDIRTFEVGQTDIIEPLADQINPLRIMWRDSFSLMSPSARANLSESVLLAGHTNPPGHFSERNKALVTQVLDLLSYENPYLQVLELATDPSQTSISSTMLGILSSDPHLCSRIGQYHWTCQSDVELQDSPTPESNIQRMHLEIANDPAQQGFVTANYDLVILDERRIGTIDINIALQHLRALLKPNGYLIIFKKTEDSQHFESAVDNVSSNASSSSQDGIATPSTSEISMVEVERPESDWKRLLKDNKFLYLAGADTEVQSTVVWAQARNDNSTVSEKVTIVCAQEPPEGLAHELSSLYSASAQPAIQTMSLASARKERGIFVCLDEIWQPLLTQLDSETFEAFKELVTNAAGVLWVTRPTRDDKCEAWCDFVNGFARSLRQENSGIKFAVLRLEAGTVCQSAIAKVFEHIFIKYPEPLNSDLEFRVVNGRIQVPRVVPDDEFHNSLDLANNTSRTDKQPFWQAGRPLEITMSTIGLFSSLHFRESTSVKATDTVKDDEVLIEVRATSINFKDVLIALGSIPWQSLGRECSGIILAVGQKARALFKPGDRVVHCGDNLFATHARCNMASVARMPDDMSFEIAASIPIVFSTAYECLIQVARLQRGEKVLIHAASGGVGQAAILIAQWIGAEIFCTVGSTEKCKFIMARYDIPRDHIFSSRSSSFATSLLSIAEGGVDIVLNSLAGELLQAGWKCLAPFGRFVEIGKKDLLSNMRLDLAPFDKGLSFHAVDLTLLTGKKASYFKTLLEKVMLLFADGVLRPVDPMTCLSVAELESGLRTLQAGKHMGKLVIVNDENAIVQATCASPWNRSIQSAGSYVITGGTGGLGRVLAKWLLEKGAKHIVLASRIGANDAKLDDLMQLAQVQGATVQVVRCDVSRLVEVEQLIAAAARVAPVRGIVHSAMVLRDAAFENASLDDWTAVVNPKIWGAWNLHQASLTQPIEFFICLSSLTGVVGVAGQTSYGAGNAFLDSFCHWRGGQGLPAAAISLPALSDVGYVAENITSFDRAKTDEIYGVSITGEQMLAVVEAAALGSAFTSANNCHTIPGLSINPELASRSMLETPMLSHIRRLCTAKSAHMPTISHGQDKGPSLKTLLDKESDYEAAFKIVAQGVMQKIAGIMMRPLEDVTLDKKLGELGLDSLVAVEFRNWMVKDLGAKIPLLDIVNSGSLGHLVTKLMRVSTYVMTKEDQSASRAGGG